MGAAERADRATEAQYLALEATSPIKHQFVNGEILAMSGARLEHNHVAMNLAMIVRSGLGDGPCRVVGSDQRVRVDETGMYAYPDLTVWCGAAQIVGPNPRSLINPTAIVEVASPTTAADDRGWKWQHYRKIATLQAYVLVDWEQRHIELYCRTGPGWLLTEVTGAGAVLVPTIAVRLDCTEVFAGLDDLVAPDDAIPADPPREG